MKTLRLVIPFLLGVVVMTTAAIFDPACPPKFEIGQTYAEIKAGPCPDIESRARWADSTTATYLCPSKMIAVVGSKHTGRMVGFFLWTGD